MKKFILIFILILIPQTIKAFELPNILPDNISKNDLNSYLNKQSLGMPYWKALEQNIPFLLIFANSDNLFSLIKLAPIAQMVYDEYQNKYNFCILNTKYQENKDFAKLFDIYEIPALIIIDTKTKTYSYVEKKYYNQRKIRQILNYFLENSNP